MTFFPGGIDSPTFPATLSGRSLMRIPLGPWVRGAGWLRRHVVSSIFPMLLAGAALFLAPASAGAGTNAVVLPLGIDDPLEPLNRVLWEINKGAMVGVVQPSGRVYRLVVCKPIRTGISNVGRNLNYPTRLVNELLQTRWEDAENETSRFLANSVFGLGGFFDVASKCNLPSTNADFNQTFAKWGWKQHFYLMLPLYGPSNDREAAGSVADSLTSPLTYFSPYSYIRTGIGYNDLTDKVEDYVRFAESSKDPYQDLYQIAPWQNRFEHFEMAPEGEQDRSTLESMRFVNAVARDAHFFERALTREARIPQTGRYLRFTYWLQPKGRPLVYLVPGVGSHRLASGALVLAERLYRDGYSVVSVSNPFNHEFIDNAATTELPGHALRDASDLRNALAAIDERLERQHPRHFGRRALLGYSMGAFHSLVIAARQENNAKLKFDRIVALNPPVRLDQGVEKLDAFYQAPLRWPESERVKKIENLFLKTAALLKMSTNGAAADQPPPFNAIESQFLIGLNFRLILRDVIFASQKHHNLGILSHPIKRLNRHDLYDEIMAYSYRDYMDKFVAAAYGSKDERMNVSAAGDLHNYIDALRKNPNVSVITNENDFLLSPEDLAWLKANFPESRLTLFPHGGHLGNFASSQVTDAILAALKPLQ